MSGLFGVVTKNPCATDLFYGIDYHSHLGTRRAGMSSMDNGVIHVTRPDDEPANRSLHGLTRSLVNNMVVGVTQEFSKELQINGVGYRAQKTGKQLIMNLGYSHQVTVDEVPGITIDVPSQDKIIIHGPDKQQVGQFAAEVREKRPPEPYKGKGIKYVEEVIIRKEGKAGKAKK